jgi:hypothetical protein
MIPAGYKEALITYADAKGAMGLQALSDEFDTLFDLINARRGKEMISSAVNGKAFGFAVQMSIEEKFSVLGQAIREINGDRVTCTYPDFSSLQR